MLRFIIQKLPIGNPKCGDGFPRFEGYHTKQNGKLESFRSHFAREIDDFIGGVDGNMNMGV